MTPDTRRAMLLNDFLLFTVIRKKLLKNPQKKHEAFVVDTLYHSRGPKKPTTTRAYVVHI